MCLVNGGDVGKGDYKMGDLAGHVTDGADALPGREYFLIPALAFHFAMPETRCIKLQAGSIALRAGADAQKNLRVEANDFGFAIANNS